VKPAAVQAKLRQIFAEHGLPQRIRVDNGAPWGSPQSDLPPALALWLIGLGVAVIWNRPRRSQENGVVERTHGVLAPWVEPECCPDAVRLQTHIDWAVQIQRERYPALDGQTRAAVYPELLKVARPYDPVTEQDTWDLDLVRAFLAQGLWRRKVSNAGYISFYNWQLSVGRPYAGQAVNVQFDAVQHQWVVSDDRGDEIKRFDAPEISQVRIRALNVTKEK
jgi:transposase InsO family protein